ncbi:MAG TPA: NAD-dependent epimerase/dehydratase family protein, partial [Myxococcaceae bacterium]|nr:NAD-dependent epimerase/dehydratase family protein [Myxococcaceae bacterium]
NVYGPRQDPHGEAGVVAIFSKNLVSGKPCTVFGDGKQTRDFVYGPDVAQANYLAFEKDYVGAVNIGTGKETDLIALYGHLAKAAGATTPAQHAEGKPGEQRRSCIDPALAAKVLGWKSTVELGEGLRRTVEYFRQPGR